MKSHSLSHLSLAWVHPAFLQIPISRQMMPNLVTAYFYQRRSRIPTHVSREQLVYFYIGTYLTKNEPGPSQLTFAVDGARRSQSTSLSSLMTRRLDRLLTLLYHGTVQYTQRTRVSATPLHYTHINLTIGRKRRGTALH